MWQDQRTGCNIPFTVFTCLSYNAAQLTYIDFSIAKIKVHQDQSQVKSTQHLIAAKKLFCSERKKLTEYKCFCCSLFRDQIEYLLNS